MPLWYPPVFLIFFQEYATLAEAEKAIIDLDGKYLAGQRIIAEYAKPKRKYDKTIEIIPYMKNFIF